jgi:exodeoxyribonuclease V beta subunit
MSRTRITFDSATACLRPGVNLVEASAGTGKTFAIAMLVLRFVAEEGFALPRILVVTFTKAATEELKARIRARLAQALELLKTEQGSTGDNTRTDPALAAWRANLAERGIAEALARERLELALLDMDLAAVFTIHGFCQRMLQEQALESGQLFDFDLTTDTSALRAQVVEDYWRRNFYDHDHDHDLSPLHCALILEEYDTPEALYKSVQGATSKGAARIEPQAEPVAATLDDFDDSCRELTAWWLASDNRAALHAVLQTAIEAGQFKQALQDAFPDWWLQVDDFLQGRSLRLPPNMERLSRACLLEELNGHKFRKNKEQSSEERKMAFLASWPLPDHEVAELLRNRQRVVMAFRTGLVEELVLGLPRTLRRHNLLSFDDLISQLARGLNEQGEGLRRILSKRYRVALIDEFQDTDAQQYAIFSALFTAAPAGSAQGTAHYLYLIGDPKQAIYTFRGADIYSYFKARERADFHLGLAKNYRSHPALVEAVNTLFGLRQNSFASSELAYFPVTPAKTPDDGQLLDGPEPLPVMVYGQLDADPDSKDGRWSAGKATEQIVATVTRECALLLRPDPPIMLAAKERPNQLLAPRDIAILVRNHRQGEQFYTALSRAGIPAVMASQQSVFASAECAELFLLMQALSAPGDIGLLKRAMASPWFGKTGPELYALWQDPEQMDDWLTRFHDYHRLWQERGFPAMMARLLESEKILLTLASQPVAYADAGAGRSGGSARKISNIHHLLELIQAAATEEAMGPEKSVQWLQQAMRDHEHSTEESELRLESDEEAVQIVTMHSAKGLEYPVVFCPFLWQRRNFLRQEKGFVASHDAQKELIMDLGSEHFDERKEQALAEELAEELRLAYVALTRARCRCYAFWADVKGSGKTADAKDSALAWLLSLENESGFAEQSLALQALVINDSVDYRLLESNSGQPVKLADRGEEGQRLAPLAFTGRNLHTDRLLHSYSSLTAAPAQANDPYFFHDSSGSQGLPGHDEDNPLLDLPELPALPDLPKGAPLGNVIHALLEELEFADLAAGKGYEELIKQQCAWFDVKVSPHKLAALLQKVVQTPLLATSPPADAGASPAPFCLADLDQAETIREMPFSFHLQPSTTGKINGILAGSRGVAPIPARNLQGYLTGFVDLICRYQGKFYVMDYKSNWLGYHADDYGPQALEQAMVEHNYGLQYWLYTLVLHRYLQTAMADYDYAIHFGGVMYLFVRGMEPTRPASGVYFDLPDQTTLERLDRCLAGDSTRTDGGSKNG